jgi:hypothetical protein
MAQLVLLSSAITAVMACALVRRASDGLTVVRLLLAGVIGIALGALSDVVAHPMAATGGERNLFPFDVALLTLFGLPGAIVGGLLGWMTRPGPPQPPAP